MGGRRARSGAAPEHVICSHVLKPSKRLQSLSFRIARDAVGNAWGNVFEGPSCRPERLLWVATHHHPSSW
jgi:hypothetical protein